MNNLKRLLSVLLVVAMILSMGAILGACDGNDGPTDPTSGASGEKKIYTVTVKTAGGMALSGVGVSVYADDSLKDMKDHGTTDADGKVSFTLAQSDSYAIELSSVPKGYQLEKSYSFSGGAATITLTSSVITDENLGNAGSLKLGDVMYDFSYTLPDGTTKKLSEVLAEKDTVLLNFWFAACGPCATEFPYMEQAYQTHKDDAEVIALSYIDSNADVAAYQSSMGLTFDMAACSPSWPGIFGFNNFPSTVMIDRYGVICLIEVGALTSLRPFTSMFEHFTADDYEQKLFNGVGELVTTEKPNVSMPGSEEIGDVINSGDITVTYKPETEGESAEYSWPFIITDKNGETCIKASNQQIDGSYAILYAEVELKAGQALGFDYLSSTERGADIMYVIVNDEAINSISGAGETEKWETCYPCVAEEDGVYEVALCYYKDGSTNVGDDTVYIKNMHVINAEDINAPTYLPRQAAVSKDGFEYTYADVVFNEKDGYYHVGSKNGPLLLANLMNYTQFSEEETIWEMALAGKLIQDGHDYKEDLTEYCSYASNSLYGVCTVNQELYELLQVVDTVVGFDAEDKNEWLKICVYYQVYGTDQQFADPIKGLATFSAYEAKLGSGNYFYYDRIIMPRGLLAEFVPTKSGVYRITSHSESTDGVESWIFDGDHNELMVYEADERMFGEEGEVSMVFYMEAGKAYYIDIAFWDPYEVGYIYYDIEFVASQYDLFRLCSPGPFTSSTDEMYDVITGGISVVLGSDGIYYEDLGKDANGKQLYGSKIYADFTGLTSIFGEPIATNNGVKGLIDKGAFDFSKSEDDMLILAYMSMNENDPEKTDEYLRNMWGDDYEANAALYQIEDVFKGKYHGKGEDLTDEISAYLDDIITSGSEERRGCVVVTEDLAKLLQTLMDKFTFEGVENSWIKLCYYYDYLGPEG